MLSQFRVLGEAFSLLRDDVHGMKPKLDKIDKLSEDMEIVKSAVRTNGQDIRALKEIVQGNTEDIRAIKSDVATLKLDVAEIKTDLKGYDRRLEVVEAKVN